MKENPKEVTGFFNWSDDAQATTILGNSEAAELFYKNVVLKNFSKFTGKDLCRRIISSQKRLRHRCFPVDFEKFLGTHFLKNNSGRLLLETK